GVMVSEDIAKSSLVNTATQSCFKGDRALFRGAADSSPSKWNGRSTEWNNSSEPSNYMMEDYLPVYGLPSTEFSVYVLNADTLKSWSEVTVNADGTYSQTIYPDVESAPKFYRCRMKTMGGLSELPTFNSIAITYTFDKEWRVLKSRTVENYSVDMGIIHSDGCEAITEVTYSYDENKVDISAYDSFFSKYINSAADGGAVALKRQKTAAEYLSSAFADVLAGGVSFDVALLVGGEEINSKVYADVFNDFAELYLQTENLKLWLKDQTLYLNYGENTLFLPVSEGLDLLNKLGGEGIADINADYLLERLGGGELVKDGENVSLFSELTIGETSLPLEFSFYENGDDVSLNFVRLSPTKFSGAEVGAELRYSENAFGILPALPENGENFVDLTPSIGYIDDVKEIIENKKLSFSGNAEIELGENKAVIAVNECHIDFNDGVSLFADFCLDLSGNSLSFKVSKDGDKYTLAYAEGGIGAEIYESQFEEVGEALKETYRRIKDVSDKIFRQDGSYLPEIDRLEDVVRLVFGDEKYNGIIKKIDGLKEKSSGEFSLEKLRGVLNGLTVSPSENAAAEICFGDISVRLLNEDGGLPFGLKTTGGEIELSGKISKTEEIKYDMPENISYLSAHDLEELADGISVAAEMLMKDSVTYDVKAAVRSKDQKYSDVGGVRLNADALLEYYSGGSFPLDIDVDGKKFTLSADMYLHVMVDVTATKADENGFYLEIYILDSDENGELDVYLSVSRYGEGDERRDPLKIYAPASETASLLSSVISLVGIDNELLSDVFVKNTIGMTKASELAAMGRSLKYTLGIAKTVDFLNGTDGDIPSAVKGFLKKSLTGENAFARFAADGLIKDMDILFGESENLLSFALNSQILYGAEGRNDLSVTVGKGEDETESYISTISLSDIYKGDSEDCEVVDLTFKAAPSSERIIPKIENYFDARHLDDLVCAVADSATYEVEKDGKTDYEVCKNYLIEGNAVVTIILYHIKIDVISVNVLVDDDGKVTVNAHLEYKGVQELGIVSINGDTEVDIAIKDGIVNIRRTQKSEWQRKFLITRRVELSPYRVENRSMTMDEFLDNLSDNISFIFNLSSTVSNLISNTFPTRSDINVEGADYGRAFKNYVSGYNFNGSKWNFDLNSEVLTNGIMDYLKVGVALGGDGLLRSLTVTGSISDAIDIEAELVYKNPKGR
ncbi:MAG: hypothetical protein IJ706_05460, partial [Clostridia bacterium]|nr:hypothetical protein [Clostridia bacterium]